MNTKISDQVQATGAINTTELLSLLSELHAAAEMFERPSTDVMARTSALLKQAENAPGSAPSVAQAPPSEEHKLLKTLDDAVRRRVRRFDGSCTLELDFRCEGMAKLIESQLKALASRA